MNGLGFSARKLTHTLCGSARRSGERDLKPLTLKYFENPAQSGCFARSGTARENKNSLLNGKLDCKTLAVIIADSPDKLSIFYLLINVNSALRSKTLHKKHR